jgi:hypothetical protein
MVQPRSHASHQNDSNGDCHRHHEHPMMGFHNVHDVHDFIEKLRHASNSFDPYSETFFITVGHDRWSGGAFTTECGRMAIATEGWAGSKRSRASTAYFAGVWNSPGNWRRGVDERQSICDTFSIRSIRFPLGWILGRGPGWTCTYGGVAQLVRVPDCRSGGCGFDSRRPR